MNRFCSECGHKMEEGQVFCSECGTQQQAGKLEEQQVPVQQQAPIQQQAPKPSRQPYSLKKKVGLTLVVLLAAGGIAGHQIIKANTEPQQKVDAFLQGLYEGDADSAMGEIIVPKETATDFAAFQEYLTEQELTGFKSRFYEAASGVVEDGITRVVLHENGTQLFKVKESKFIGMYPGIEIEAIPMDVELASDVEGMEFILGDTTVKTVDGELALGQYLPGVYDCSLSMKNGEVEKMIESECGLTEGDEVLLDFSLKDLGVEVWSNDEEAIVYINEKSTGKTVKDLPFIGPIDGDETVKLFAERKNEKGDVEQSEVIQAGAGSFIQLPIYSTADADEEKDEETKDAENKNEENNEDEAEEEEVEEKEEETVDAVSAEQLQIFISNFRSAYESSLNAKDFSIVEGYLKDGSSARKELVDFIGSIGNDYYLYEFWVDEAVGVEILGDKAFVSTYEEFDFTNHLGEVTNYKRSKKYEVQGLDSGDLRIAKIDIIDTKRN